MNSRTLIKRNLAHYWRTNAAVILGVATAVAVLAGALLVGDSVRASLRDLALARLGKTDFVITSAGFFREQLAGDLPPHDQFAANFHGACPIIAIEGVVTRDESNARAGGVQVYGVDERFWKFHGANVQTPEENDVLISQSLAQELNAKSGDTIILRIAKPSAIPTESLHGRKADLGRTVRFTVREALPAASLGEFSLRPQQGAVRAIFVSLKKLQRNIEQESKANAILLAAKSGASWQLAPQILKDKFALADLGLKLRVLEAQRAVALESDSAVISDALAEKAKPMAEKPNLRAAEILTYLANTISLGEKTIPYSLVTALDQQSFDNLIGEGLRSTAENQIVLNDWAARDLGAKTGDVVTLEYYLWREEGRLDTQQAKFAVERIVPLAGIAADRNFAPEYPGITESQSLADWDPPFPMDLSRVRPKDEDYWHQYRTTPKAFIQLAAGQKLWSSRYGRLTSIRMVQKGGGAPTPGSEAAAMRSFEKDLRAALDPAQMGLTVQPVKEQSLQAARGATDFGQYFTYFSFFLVVSALLLTTLFFKLGIEQRLREIGLLLAVGFSIKQIRSLFLREGFVLAVAGSVAGVIGAIAYGALMMFGLRTWWVGAVGTTLLKLHITPQSLLIGGLAGIVTALICVWWTLRSLSSASPRSLLTGSIENERTVGDGVQSTGFSRLFRGRKLPPEGGTLNAGFTSSRLALIFGLLGLLLLVAAALKLIGQVGGFFGAGALLLIAILSFWSTWLRSDKKRTIHGQGLLPMARLGFRNASSRPGRSGLCIALIASAVFIVVSVDAFRRDGRANALDRNSGNGGYPLMAESLLPIIHDPNSGQGREELNLSDGAVADVKITRFRLRPGDDASCLNLYQPRNPRILGAGDGFIRESRFAFQSSLAKTDEEKSNPWLLLSGPDDATVPVAVDANSMTYVLQRKLGDQMTVNASDGRPVKLRIVAALADSIFQSELLMSEKNFLKLFPDQEGYRVFLIDAAPDQAADVAAALEEKLSDFGFDATGTEEKLAGFHQVENTYLSTFQTLGGLGLLLGTLGLAAVLLRNVLERRRELALMRAVGFQSSHLSLMVIAENALLLGCGLLTGTLCALLAIIPALVARGGRLSAVSLGLLLLAVLLAGLAASLVAVRAAIRSPLLAALRTE
jgi:ABC-type antimicrobial peptide transport system permease subunit